MNPYTGFVHSMGEITKRFDGILLNWSGVSEDRLFFFSGERVEQKKLIALSVIQMLTLGVGFAVLLTSLLLTYIVSSKADILFSSEREPSNATY